MEPTITDAHGAAITVGAPAGQVTGRAADGIARFLGIPYAEMPTGTRRFAAPVPRARFTEPLDAVAYGATPQRVPLFATTTVPEPTIPGDDILTLNIFAPADAVAGASPVLVWVHGGGFVAGSAASPWYDGRRFAREGVVVVSVSYRLAVDGFAPLPGVPTNLGLRDVLLALAWVQENVASFGGDPAQVTLAGQSAGGGIALALLSSPASEGLFQRAVSVSGGTFALDRERVLGYVSRLAASLGVEPTRDGFAGISDREVQQMMVDIRDNGDEEPLVLSPTVGDDILPDPIVVGLEKRGGSIPLLLGSTLDEFDGGPTPESPARPRLTDTERAAARASGTRITDTLFRSAVPRCAAARRASPAGTWAYSFEWPSPVLGGATHCSDIPFFFDVLDAPGIVEALSSAAPAEVAAVMHADLLAFVRGEEPAWPGTHGEHGAVSRVYGRQGADPAVLSVGDYDAVSAP